MAKLIKNYRRRLQANYKRGRIFDRRTNRLLFQKKLSVVRDWNFSARRRGIYGFALKQYFDFYLPLRQSNCTLVFYLHNRRGNVLNEFRTFLAGRNLTFRFLSARNLQLWAKLGFLVPFLVSMGGGGTLLFVSTSSLDQLGCFFDKNFAKLTTNVVPAALFYKKQFVSIPVYKKYFARNISVSSRFLPAAFLQIRFRLIHLLHVWRTMIVTDRSVIERS